MAGSRKGGLKAAKKNTEYDPDFYSRIGRIGGRNGHTGGFASKSVCFCPIILGEHHKAMCAGKKGGTISRRQKKVV